MLITFTAQGSIKQEVTLLRLISEQELISRLNSGKYITIISAESATSKNGTIFITDRDSGVKIAKIEHVDSLFAYSRFKAPVVPA